MNNGVKIQGLVPLIIAIVALGVVLYNEGYQRLSMRFYPPKTGHVYEGRFEEGDYTERNIIIMDTIVDTIIEYNGIDLLPGDSVEYRISGIYFDSFRIEHATPRDNRLR